MSPSKLPAAGRHEAILTVPAFGRYAVLVRSSQGTGVQLIDRLAGPSEVQGTLGKVDGRIDQFLDRGTYKVITQGHRQASGEAKVEAHAFRERNTTPPLLIEPRLVRESLDDFEQRSYWIDIRERRQIILEAAGRNLTDLRLWNNGDWLVDLTPVIEVIEPIKGQPLLTCRMTAELDPGLYLLTAYGGISQPWANDSKEHPFYLRSGIPKRPQVARSHHTVSPFGVDRWLVPGDATYFRVELPEAQTASLNAGQFREQHPFDEPGSTNRISKNSLVPVAAVEIGRHDWQIVTVRGTAGQSYVLQHFNAGEHHYGIGREWALPASGPYWVSTVHSGNPDDSVDATGMVLRVPRTWREGEHAEPFATQVIVIDAHTPWVRRANLLATLTLFVQVKESGKYQVVARGPKAKFRFEPFLLDRPRGYETPELQASGFVWDLDAGYYVLTASPEQHGVIDLGIFAGEAAIGDDRLNELLGSKPAVHAAVQFPRLSIDVDGSRLYKMFVNDQPEVQVGMVLRPLPTDLTDALPVVQYAGETIEVPFSVGEPGVLRAEAEDGTLVDVSLDGGQAQPTQNVAAGQHTARVRWDGPSRVHYALSVEPRRLQSDTPLPPLPDPSRTTPPKLPVLGRDEPQFFELERDANKVFLVRADTPALYRLESTGLLATEGNLRTRTVISFDRQSENGVGRNFFIQQYLREGDYQVTVATRGDSRGHLGLTLDKTPMIDGGTLREGAPARITLPSGNAVQYTFTIGEAGTYRLRCIGVGKTFRGRLEDAEGWPIEKPNLALDLTRDFDPGTYRVISLPEPVASRRQTLLERVRQAPAYKGHGPHALPIGVQVEHKWFEPESGGTRTPDSWEFALPASVDATIGLSGEMQAELFVISDDRGLRSVASIPAGRGWSGWRQKLEPGRYRLQVVSARPNNDLAYTVAVRTDQLVAGLSRSVTAPARIPLSVARSGILQLSSFGSTDVRARLFDDHGRLVGSNDDGPDDWNFELQQQVGAGFYDLHVDPVGPQTAQVLAPQPTPTRSSEDDADADAEGDSAAANEPVEPTPEAACVVAMREPEDQISPLLNLPARRDVAIGNTVLVYPLELPHPADVLALQAQSAEALGMALESSADGNAWRSVGGDVGRSVRLATPLEAGHRYRLRMWSLDGREQTAHLRAAALRTTTIQEAGLHRGVTLAAAAGSDPPLAAVKIELTRAGTLRFDNAGDLRSAGNTDAPCTTSPDGIVSSSGPTLWIVADLPSSNKPFVLRGSRLSVGSGGAGVQLTMSGSRFAASDLDASPGPILATATTLAGQPGIRIVKRTDTFAPSGTTMAVGARTAVSLALDGKDVAALMWPADGAQEASFVKLSQTSFSTPQLEAAAWGGNDIELSGIQARSFSLPAGSKRLRLSVDASMVAALSTGAEIESLHWQGDRPFEEDMHSAAERLTLLHTSPGRSRAHIEILPAAGSDPPVVTAETAFEAAYPQAGVQRVRVAARPDGNPGVLHVRGGLAEGALFLARDGDVLRGHDLPLRSDGTLLVPHAPGLLLAWEDYSGGSGQEIWGSGMVPEPQRVDAPAALPLSGASQAFWIKVGDPALIQLRSSQPTVSLVRHEDGTIDTQLHGPSTVVAAYAARESLVLALRGTGGASLSGVAELTSSPLVALQEGSGPEALVSAGTSRLYSFQVVSDATVGIGVRADPDVVTAILRDARGTEIGRGVVQMPKLKTGAYLLEVKAPPGNGPVRVRPAVVGIERPSTAPPQDVIRAYMNMATAPEPAVIETGEEE